MKAVPDRWLEYKPYGRVIRGTRILPFKVPLKEAIARNLKLDERFTPADLLEDFPKLKYVIDLTNTERYYNSQEFASAGVHHEKITIPGRQVPLLDKVKIFFRAMDDFLSASRKGELVGVHCTHGINRTGYLICRYLIEQRGWSVLEAINAFQEARGYPIEREEYVAALKTVPPNDKLNPPPMKLMRVMENSESLGPVSMGRQRRWDQPPVMGPPPRPPRLSRPPRLPRRLFDGPFGSQPLFNVNGPRPNFGPMPPPLPPPPHAMGPIPPPPPPEALPRPPFFGSRMQRYQLRPIKMPRGPRPPPTNLPARMPPPVLTANFAAFAPVPLAPLPPIPPALPPSRRRLVFNRASLKRKACLMNGSAADPFDEQDFTADTFEENLLAASRSQ